MRYLQEAQGRRRDVRVLPVGVLSFAWFRPVTARHMPDVRLPDTPFTFRALLDANAGRPIFVCNRVPWLQTLEDGYALWRAGLAEEVLAALVAAAEAASIRPRRSPSRRARGSTASASRTGRRTSGSASRWRVWRRRGPRATR